MAVIAHPSCVLLYPWRFQTRPNAWKTPKIAIIQHKILQKNRNDTPFCHLTSLPLIWCTVCSSCVVKGQGGDCGWSCWGGVVGLWWYDSGVLWLWQVEPGMPGGWRVTIMSPVPTPDVTRPRDPASTRQTRTGHYLFESKISISAYARSNSALTIPSAVARHSSGHPAWAK